MLPWACCFVKGLPAVFHGQYQPGNCAIVAMDIGEMEKRQAGMACFLRVWEEKADFCANMVS